VHVTNPLLSLAKTRTSSTVMRKARGRTPRRMERQLSITWGGATHIGWSDTSGLMVGRLVGVVVKDEKQGTMGV
jgi:hypothetical protein